MGFSSGQLAQASMATQVGGSISSAAGSYYGAKGKASSLEFQSQLADINARMAEQTAQSELLKGQKQVAAVTLKAGKLKSKQRATMAANGIDLGEGNAAEVQASTDIMKEIDKNTIEANALRSAWGYRKQGGNFKNDAAMKRASASGVSPFGAASTSLLGSASGVMDSWYKYKKSTSGTKGIK